MSKPTLTVTSDFTDKFNETIKRFKSDEVLVGIPEEDTNRDVTAQNAGTAITNAALLAINHFGSPMNNIPPRPVMTVGIKNAQDAIAEQFKQCAKDALTKGPSAVGTYYERAGIIASNSVKKAINDQDFGPDSPGGPSEATLKARKYIGKSGFKGDKSLVVTGQMRNAITYVVNSKWAK